MVYGEALLAEGSDRLLADVLENQELEIVVFDGVKDLWLANVGVLTNSAKSVMEGVVSWRHRCGDHMFGGTGDGNWVGHDGLVEEAAVGTHLYRI